MIATLKPNGDASSDATDGKELEWSSWFGSKKQLIKIWKYSYKGKFGQVRCRKEWTHIINWQ